MPQTPIDTATSAPIALSGRVVTMNDTLQVVNDGTVYMRNGDVVAVEHNGWPVPAGFESAPLVATRGTIFPGLIELHNHLSYDVLPLWQVPQPFEDRDQWGSPFPPYKQLISGPMQVLGGDAAVASAIVRYVEVKCLLGGTTTSQGMRLFSDPAIITQYRGLVRNVEETGDPALPNATARISDVAAKDSTQFLGSISGNKKTILHLSEGIDNAAHRHFASLEIAPNKWAITPNLIGIHCVALTDSDFATFSTHGGSMVWSPLSNLLLYGQTADVRAAHAHDVPIALGSDWSPSGSKNLLGELKVAKLATTLPNGGAFSDQQLVEMATTTPAKMLGWQDALGSIGAGKRADVIVIGGHTGDPYAQLIAATERDVHLVVINGVPRVGTTQLMHGLGITAGTETHMVDGSARLLNLAQTTADPGVEQLTLAAAAERLAQALHGLGNTAAPAGKVARAAPENGMKKIAVDGLVPPTMTNRPHLEYRGHRTGAQLKPVAKVKAAELSAINLDRLTAIEDAGYYATIAQEENLPGTVRNGIVAHAPH
jgi:hypothetical protein